MPKYNKNNHNHAYFHGNQESLDKSTARGIILDMLDCGDITKEQKERYFEYIDKYITRSKGDILEILIDKSDIGGVYIEID